MITALTDLKTYKKNNFTDDKQLSFLGDIDGNHVVTNADLQALLNRVKSGGGSFSAVPEPSSILLVAATALSLILMSRARLKMA